MRFLKKLNTWSKKYQSVIQGVGILAILVGLFSLKLDLNSHEFEKKKFSDSQIPIWDIKMNYHENNVDLLSINFSCLNDNVKLQKVTIFYINNKRALSEIVSLSNVWKTSDFSTKLLQVIKEFYTIDEYIFESYRRPGIVNFNDCYPIAVKFFYVQDGIVKEITSVFLVHFQVLKMDRIKIRNLEYVKNLQGIGSPIENELGEINCSTCIGRESCSQNNSINAFIKKNKTYNVISNLIDLSYRGSVITVVKEDKNGNEVEEPKKYMFPTILVEKEIYQKFESNFKEAQRNKQLFDSEIADIINELELFLSKNPICKNFDTDCLTKSSWVRSETLDKWKELNKRLEDSLITLSRR